MSNNIINLSKRLNITSFVKDIFIQFLKDVYSVDSEFTFTDNDDVNTKVQIYDRKPVNISGVNNKPHITVIRTPIRFTDIAINQSVGSRFSESQNVYKDMLTGNIVVECCSRIGLESEILATTTAVALASCKNVLYRNGIHKIQNVTISEEQTVDATSDYEMVKTSVIVTYFISLSWIVTEVAPLLNGWDTRLIVFTTTNPAERLMNNTAGLPEVLAEAPESAPVAGEVIDPYTEDEKLEEEDPAEKIDDNGFIVQKIRI